jgi:hypothetical protein
MSPTPCATVALRGAAGSRCAVSEVVTLTLMLCCERGCYADTSAVGRYNVMNPLHFPEGKLGGEAQAFVKPCYFGVK